MLGRREMLKGAAVGLAPGALSAPAIAQSSKRISFLTWNLIDQEALVRGWIGAFQKANPGIEVEWLDKKGPELLPFYQTQLTAGTPPDVVDIQGPLWLEYAAGDVLLDLSERAGPIKGRFNADYLQGWAFEGRQYLLPLYITKSLYFMNRTLCSKAGLEAPPTSFDALLAAADALATGDQTGFLTLNFDWLYWPLMQQNGVQLLSPDLKHPAFNTARAVEVVDRLAQSTAKGGINKISWTGRWVEPNGAFSAGTVGMLQAVSTAYFFIKGQAAWANPQTLMIGEGPGDWSTPNNHGLAISKATRQPDAAWAFVQFITDAPQAAQLAESRKIVTGNSAVDEALLARVKGQDTQVYDVLRTQLAHTDKLCGQWKTPMDTRIKDAFWPELQSALLGRKPAKQALADAERRVSRELARA